MKSVLSIAAAAALGALPAMAEEAAATVAEQTDVSVTAYNAGLALVRDVRKLSLPTGDVRLRFGDVAEQIQAQTVSLQSLSAPGSITIYEQNYEFDLISPEKLMEKYVGRDVTLLGIKEDEPFGLKTGKLLSTNGGPIYEIDGQIYIGHPGTVVLPEMPENLIAKPSLIWELGNQQGGQEIAVTYLTNGISWQADYVLTLAKDETKFDLAGWVTLNNQSGAPYNNAKLKLVAGDVNVVQEQFMKARAMDAVAEMAMPAAAPMAQEETFAEYHLYTMPRRTTIKQNQSKQLALLQATGTPVRKVYELRGGGYYFYQQIGEEKDMHPSVFLVFENKEENQLGMPLPAGTVRVYQPDSEGTLQFAGEDRIKHTPKNEEVRLRLGEAFDVVADRRQMDWNRIGNNVYESSYEIEVRNRKETPVTVEVIEPMSGEWTILKSSVEHTKRDAFTAVFPVTAGPNEEVTLTYTVRVTN